MPRIYTMCVPVAQNDTNRNHTTVGSESSESGMGLAKGDLSNTREEVVVEVAKAPERRVDNIITRLVPVVFSLCYATTLTNQSADCTTMLLLSRCTSGLVRD